MFRGRTGTDILKNQIAEAIRIARTSEKLVLKYNSSWIGANIKRFEPKAPNGSADYFDCLHCLAYDIEIPFTRES
jgi:hypothetical protein